MNFQVKKYSGSYAIKKINKQASIVEISKESKEPQKDVKFINTLMQTYIHKGLSDKNQISVNTIQFIDKYLINVTDSLQFFEDKLQDFKIKNNLVDISAQGKNLMDNIYVIENKKAEEEIKQKYYIYLLDYLNKSQDLNKIIAPSVMGIPDPLLNQLIGKLSQLYAEKLILELNSQKLNPSLIEKNKAIESIKSTIIENLKRIKSSYDLVLK